MRFDEMATCPFCGEKLRLATLPIVATNVIRGSGPVQSDAPGAGGGIFGDLDPAQESVDTPAEAHGQSASPSVRPVSGTRVLETRNGWPVVAHPPPPPVEPTQRSFLRRREPAQAATVWDLAKHEDLPARLCDRCETPLPVDIDERRLFTIAVVGTNGSSKTHFLTSALHEAYHEQALDKPFDCVEFAPDEVTSDRYHNEYYRPLFADRIALRGTQVNQPEVRFHPLAFRVTFEQNPKPSTLLFHDVAGEVLRDRAARASVAPFVRRADAVIFLIDPRWFQPVGAYLEKEYGIPNEIPPFNQADLFNAVAEEMRSRNLDQIPVSVAISKSDLISAALGRKFTFDKDPPQDRDGWIQQIKEIDDEVVDLLKGDLKSRDLLAAIRKFPDVTFHAVAPIGSQPSPPDAANNQAISVLNPRRCLDPLISVLLSLMHI